MRHARELSMSFVSAKILSRRAKMWSTHEKLNFLRLGETRRQQAEIRLSQKSYSTFERRDN